jgi:hypothetical protein
MSTAYGESFFKRLFNPLYPRILGDFGFGGHPHPPMADWQRGNVWRGQSGICYTSEPPDVQTFFKDRAAPILTRERFCASLLRKNEKERRDRMQAYCMKCRAKKEMKNAKAITMKNGKPATQGVCPVCGTKMFKIGKG